MKCVLPPRLANNDAFDIVNLTPDFKLCCKDGAPCRLCMAIDIEIKLSQHHQNSTEQPKDSEDTRNTKGTICNLKRLVVVGQAVIVVPPAGCQTLPSFRVTVVIKQS